MKHHHYFEITSPSYYDAGFQLGRLFGDFMGYLLEDAQSLTASPQKWRRKTEKAQALLKESEKVFPQYVEEMKGLSEGAGLSFDDLWTLSLEDELDASEHCSSFVVNQGELIGHNEDWDADSEDCVVVLKRTIKGQTQFGLYYIGTLGGNSISINSSGCIHVVNSVFHEDHQVGIPRNVVARWLSDTENPEQDLQRLTKLTRSSGYHHILVKKSELNSGKTDVWSAECSARRSVIQQPSLPFVHTNHYLSNLSELDEDDESEGSRRRFKRGHQLLSQNSFGQISVRKMMDILRDQKGGRHLGVFNRRTIASMVIDLANRKSHIWLRREDQLGWVSYDLS